MIKKILVVDDEPDLVTAVEYWLKANGHDVITASDGEMALEKARKEKPDLVILDLMLPKLNGYEVCKIFEVEKELKQIPVIMLTGRGDTNDIKEGLKVGAATYVTKPFKAELLMGIIKGLLGDPPQGHYVDVPAEKKSKKIFKD